MERLLHDLVRNASERHPDRIAVEDGERRLTYRELHDASERVANLLIQQGVRRGHRVGLYLEKSLDSVVGIYGVLRAGAAYVPLDPRAPVPRLAFIARDCGIRVLLSGSEKAERWPELLQHGAPVESIVVLNADEVEPGSVTGPQVLTARDVEAQEVGAPPVELIDQDLAYILYTSGSTGNPKGVMLSHLNALAFVLWVVETFDVRSDDRLSNHAPLHFDLSVLDLYAAAAAGAAVVLLPPELSVFPVQIRDFIRDRGITIWYSVPSILSMLTLRGGLERGDLPGLRTLLFAGEVFPTKYLRELMRVLPHVDFVNLYGPTETNVCTWYDVTPIDDDRTEPIPIGRAIAGVEVFAMTEEGREALPGEVGELLVRGNTVMHGYWGDPERTRRSLVPDPRGTGLRDPAYKTGDLVKRDENGDYLLLGRRDHQIKSRGYRIELGEIESAIYSHPDVVECAVLAVPDELVTNRIEAVVVARNGLTEGDLVRLCGERVPHYMVPERFEFVESLPKTSTGKVDRQALFAGR